MKLKYIKIRTDFKYASKGRFYRTFLVKEDVNLGELGEFIVDIFGGTLEHFFLYRLKDRHFVPTSWMEECYDPTFIKYEPFKEKSLSDLPSLFEFVYDTGEGYDFTCKIYKYPIIKDVDKDDIPFGFVLEGRGMGIWEDNIGSLYAYLNGEIDKDFNQEDEERCIFKPWNFSVDKYSEFDDPINIEDLNDTAMNFFPIGEFERY